jgi:hypothetical protein
MSALPTQREITAQRPRWLAALEGFEPVCVDFEPVYSHHSIQPSPAMMTGGQNDYSACTTWFTHKNDAYLLHVYRGRLEYPELRVHKESVRNTGSPMAWSEQ